MRIVVKVTGSNGEFKGVGHAKVHHFKGESNGNLIVYEKRDKVEKIYWPGEWVSVAVTDKQELVD